MKKRLGLLFLTCFLILSGCGRLDNTTVVLTDGFKSDEVFYIEHSVCTLPEFMVYLTNIQNQYVSSFGEEIFTVDNAGVTLEDTLKSQVIEKLASVKIMNLLAQEKGVSLDDENMANVKNAASAYFSTLSEEEKDYLGVDYEKIENMYEELALSQKCYNYLIADINPEISDDEARTITVQQIFIKTYYTDENGEKQPISDLSYAEAKEKINEAYNLILEGTDFDSVANEYSDSETVTYSFGKGIEDTEFEDVAFSLSKGELSDIVETDYGFYIIKCLTTFNKEETDKNKVKIVEERRKEVFEEEYNRFAKNLMRLSNDKLIDNISVLSGDEITTEQFFNYYETYISK